MSTKIVLFCKSYSEDVLRARRLIESVTRHNTDHLPLFVSVPEADASLFGEKCKGLEFSLLTDEQVVAANDHLDAAAFAALPGGISQQIVKAEFWRLGIGDTYVCLDSDCYFLKDFRTGDFISPGGTPYTVMHEAKDLLHFAELSRMQRIVQDRDRECGEIKGLFSRQGRCWDFGPVPVVWSGRVWNDLSEKYLRPRNMTIMGAIEAHPGELRWYGEALLAYGSIPIVPIEPLFRCYHYEEQYYFWKRMGETEEVIAKNYLGICRQSNWDKDLDLVKRFRFSKLRRRVRRAIRGY
ncbi:MAG: hypothetical protein JSU95_17640 [Betaproteobacteria bacterium]|nr:MAG: hypothetical protein JSU95_17640 [Betaproteobacteria bacterium]